MTSLFLQPIGLENLASSADDETRVCDVDELARQAAAGGTSSDFISKELLTEYSVRSTEEFKIRTKGVDYRVFIDNLPRRMQFFAFIKALREKGEQEMKHIW